MEEQLERIAKDVVDASVKLHMALGPGLLESVYKIILKRSSVNEAMTSKERSRFQLSSKGRTLT